MYCSNCDYGCWCEDCDDGMYGYDNGVVVTETGDLMTQVRVTPRELDEFEKVTRDRFILGIERQLSGGMSLFDVISPNGKRRATVRG